MKRVNMKKKLKYIPLFLIIIIVFCNNISAANYTNGNVKVSYDKNTKELYAYGYNKHGNLGTGDFNEVKKEDKVRLNDKINNQKIVDYVFTDAQTYLLSDKGKVYASGYRIGDGSKKTVYKTFREVKLYNSKNVKVKKLLVLDIKKGNNENLNDKNAKSIVTIKLKTNKKNINYILENPSSGVVYDGRARYGYWQDLYTYYEKGATFLYRNKPHSVYQKQINKNESYELYFDKNAKKKFSYYVNKKKKSITKKWYQKGIIKKSYYGTEKIKVLKYYNDGKLTNKKTRYYANLKKKKPDNYSRITTKKINTKYLNQKTNNKKTYYRVNGKLVLRYQTDYYRNTKGQLKSNKHGKALKITKTYKNGKVISKKIYYFNSKGEIYKKNLMKT